MLVNLLIEFHREKHNLYKSYTYKIKTMTRTSINTHLKYYEVLNYKPVYT